MAVEITDAELSLEVARIMYGSDKVELTDAYNVMVVISDAGGFYARKRFSYITDDALSKMIMWLAERVDGGNWLTIGDLLQTRSNPHKEIAMVINMLPDAEKI